MRLDPRIKCPLIAGIFHTLKVIRMFAQVHALVKHDLNFIRCCGSELCEAFLIK